MVAPRIGADVAGIHCIEVRAERTSAHIFQRVLQGHDQRLHQPLAWLKYWPDWQAFRTFAPLYFSRHRDRRDDSLLGAVADALPILQSAASVHIITATDNKTPEQLASGAALASHLAEHGIKTVFETVRIDGSSVGKVFE